MTFAPQTFQHATKVPQTFPELLALYKEKLADSQLDLSGENDPRTRPGMEIRKNGATQALPGLHDELVRSVEQNAGAIFLSGTPNGVASFIDEAEDLTEGAIILVSAREMYEELGKDIEGGLRRDRRFSMDTMNAFVGGAMKLLDKLEVDGIPSPDLARYLNKVFETPESVTALAFEILQGLKAANGVTIGDGLNAIYIQGRAADEAIKESIATPFLPVIVLGATEEEAETLSKSVFFGRNVRFQTVKDQTDANTVVLVFNELKKKRAENRGTR
jgi:hypothetical protein